MDEKTQLILVDSAIRWCNNILVEVRSSCMRSMSQNKQQKLKEVCLLFQELLEPEIEQDN